MNVIHISINFDGHLNLDFDVEVTVPVANLKYDKSITYYAYHYNEDTKDIENLGVATVTEKNGYTYVSFKTNSFSDFFISTVNKETEESRFPVWAIVVIALASIALVAGIIVVIIKNKKDKQNSLFTEE